VAPAQVADMDGWQKANEFGSTLFWVGLAFTRKP
jgi:hypothetical protein